MMSLARAMPKLGILRLCDRPYRRIPASAAVKGPVILAYHCPELSTLCVALTLVRIFPRIEYVNYGGAEWEKVEDVICLSNRIISRLFKQLHPLNTR